MFILVCAKGQVRTLESYIEQAGTNSPLIRSYQNQITSLALDSQIIRASLRTQVNFLSNEYYAPTIKGFGYDPAISNIAQLSALMQATRNIVSRNNLSAQYRNITLQSQALRDTVQLSIRDLQRSITDQYITAYGDLLTMNYSKELFDVLKEEEVALRKMAAASVIKQTEYLAFAVTMQQQELTYLQAQIQYNADFLTLNYMAGIPDTAITLLQEPHFEDSIPKDLYSSVFYHRFITDSLRIENQRRLIYYNYRPVIGATIDGGYNSSLQFDAWKNFGYSLGLSVRVPIYDGHQKKMRYQQLDIEERTREYNKNFFISQYNQQLTQLYKQLNETERLYDKIRQQVEYSRTLIISYGKLMATGDVRITDVVTAITNYLNAQNTFRQNTISRLRVLNQIRYWNY
jgi:outer membrane protein TolC